MANGRNRAMLKKAFVKGKAAAGAAVGTASQAVGTGSAASYQKARATLGPRSGAPLDDPLLLWGILHIKIVRCSGLKNLDFTLLNKGAKSDPYVVANIGPTRILKTTIKMDDLNPVYDEEFYCYVAHTTKEIAFKVIDYDDISSDDTIGKYKLDVRELVRFPSEEDWSLPEMARQDRLLRAGVHKSIHLNGKKKNGSLEFFVEFVPKHMLGKTLEVPGVYFPATTGNDVSFYVNADDDGTSPKVTYRGSDGDKRKFKPGRLWRDIYDALCEAKHLIYAVGWSFDVDQHLLRGEELDHLGSGGYSAQIGPLLKAKADEGVVVNLMQWDDFSSNIFNPGGKMGTHDEKARNFFKGTKVNAEFMGTKGDGTNTVWQGQNKTMFFTHHQKFVVCDAPRGRSGERELLAFVGGIDLTEGRWDNRQHPLFRGLDTVFKGDCYNKCYRFHDKNIGPRQPWHDIHSAVRGPEALDLCRAFHERWLSQACPTKVPCLVNMETLGFNKETLANSKGWHCQLSRSIDARICEFDRTIYQSFRHCSPDQMKPPSADWIPITADQKDHPLSRRFETTDGNMTFNRTLDMKKGRDVDKSIELTNIHHIRRAKHFIYIESQYFLSSSHWWTNEKNRSVKCSNGIAIELALKICEKIAKGERFAVYILLPMWCEGLPDSEANQEILYWQWSTIEMMHRVVQEAIDERVATSTDSGLEVTDYLNFYCLGNREVKDDRATPTVPVSPDEKVLAETRRHQIYIHSKFMIVDDEVALIGTANVNQRSMDGCRDSEIMMTSWHPKYLATENSIAKGKLHGYRKHCWATITNQMLPAFNDPKSIECVRAMNEIAESNWKKYSGDRTVEMDSHLLMPPLQYYGKEVGVTARNDMPEGMFLDTKASVKGKDSRHFPDIILT